MTLLTMSSFGWGVWFLLFFLKKKKKTLDARKAYYVN
jgi:hypothetical protein